jgi:hypothetical protein
MSKESAWRRGSRGTPLVVAIAGFALAAGAVFVFSFARKALERLTTLRVKPPPGEASPGKESGANGAPNKATRREADGSEADAIGRAENEGLHPDRW